MAHENNVYCIISIGDIDNLDYSELVSRPRKSLDETMFLIEWSKLTWGEDVPPSVAAANCLFIDGRTMHTQKEALAIMQTDKWTETIE